MISALILCLALVLAASRASLAQEVAARSLPKADVTFEHEFSSLSGIRELRDGRLIALDAREKSVLVLDPRTGGGKQLGREGSGPGEYTRPTSLLALPNDTTLIQDSDNRRYLVLAGSSVLGTMPLVTLRPSAGVTYGPTIKGADKAGALYFELPLGMIANRDAGTPILRYDRRTQRIDSVAMLSAEQSTPNVTPGVRQGGTGMGMRLTGARLPFNPIDDWDVTDEGDIAIARVEPFRIEWITRAGTRSTGPTQRYGPIPVTNADKEEWRDEMRAVGGGTLTTTDASGRTQTQKMPIPEPTSWPDQKPPFVAGAVLASPDGQVWLLRSRAAADKSNTYDVFDQKGVLVDRIIMPRDTRLIGFGRGVVYTVRRDENDLRFIQRHPMTPAR